MNQLRIDEQVFNILIEHLLSDKHLCIIGGSKCGKSKLAEELIKRLSKKYGNYTKKQLDKIPGVYAGYKYIIPNLDKPIVYLKNVSGLSLLNLEKILNESYLITTFPVLNLNLLHNRFIAFNSDYDSINNFNQRVWDCIPLVAENKKLSDGNVYLMQLFKTSYTPDSIEKDSLCRFVQNQLLFEEEFSRVTGKYHFKLKNP